jgi:hypothetical protein
MRALVRSKRAERIEFVYTNSTDSRSSEKYDLFKDAMSDEYEETRLTEDEFAFIPNLSYGKLDTSSFMRQRLTFKE